MEYIVCKIYDRKGIDGPMTLHPNTTLPAHASLIWNAGRRVCFITSQSAYDHFALNDDGQGKKRFSLTHNILNEVGILKSNDYQNLSNITSNPNLTDKQKEIAINELDFKAERFFDEMKKDEEFNKLMNPLPNGDRVWNFAFYNAEIETLERLNALLEEIKNG